MKRILITGSREFTDRDTVNMAIRGAYLILGREENTVVVHGGAPGADTIAGEVWGGMVEVHKPDWEKEGKAAGPIRNAYMVALGADVCRAFFKRGAGNRGTKHCSDLARKAGIPVFEFWQDA